MIEIKKTEIKKRITRVLIILMTLAAVTAAPVFCRSITSYAADEEQSSFEYKKYEGTEQYLKVLKRRMNGVYTAISGRINDRLTMPEPGIITTVTRQEGRKAVSEDFVPQGLCRTGDYMLITAYDVKKQRNSVIYAVDMNKRELISTLTMPNKYHAGGIAFDGTNIWMTGDTSDSYKGQPFVQYMTYEKFLHLIERPVCEVKEADISAPVYIKNKPSFLECDKGVLWVGTYMGRKSTAEGYMNGYRIITRDNGDTVLNTMMYSIIAGIDSSAQGADIDGNFLYVSSSYNGMLYGVKSSFITKYYIRSFSAADNMYVKDREISRVEVPKMNEEIVVDNSHVYINFESGADYWKRCVIITDRILAVNKSVWGL